MGFKNMSYIARNKTGMPYSVILYLFEADILVLKIKNNDQILGNKASNFSKEHKHVHRRRLNAIFEKYRPS